MYSVGAATPSLCRDRFLVVRRPQFNRVCPRFPTTATSTRLVSFVPGGFGTPTSPVILQALWASHEFGVWDLVLLQNVCYTLDSPTIVITATEQATWRTPDLLRNIYEVLTCRVSVLHRCRSVREALFSLSGRWLTKKSEHPCPLNCT